MSKTYKHIAKYKQGEYWQNNRIFGRIQTSDWVQVGDDYIIAWQTRPPTRKEKEPFPWYWHGIDNRSKQAVEKSLQRRYRHKVKRLIRQGEYDNLPTKPEDSAWILW